MDASVSAQVFTGVSLVKSEAVHFFAVLIPIASIVFISVAVAHFMIKKFKQMAEIDQYLAHGNSWGSKRRSAFMSKYGDGGDPPMGR